MAVIDIPCEVLEQILGNENLGIHDVMNFAFTCKSIYWTVTTSNKLWRTKFLQRWPFLREAFEDLATDSDGVWNRDIHWREETKVRMACREKLEEKLNEMSERFCIKAELSARDLKDWDPLFLPEQGANPMYYHYLTEEIIRILELPKTEGNLTHKHYGWKAIRYLRQTYLAREWEKFLALPPERQTTELGAVLVAQWSQPDKRVSAKKVSQQLDELAQETRDTVAANNPEIPINSTSRAELARWKVENLYDNVWSNEDSHVIVKTLCDVMFKRCNFSGNSEMYYSSVNSFIDKVLENRRGIPITLAIVFESAARRLGLHCETVSFPAHFLLRWKERYIPKTEKDTEVESYYIDVFNGGKFLTKNNCSAIAGAMRCPIEKYNVHQATSAVKVVQRMAGNLEVAGRQRTQLNMRATRLLSALELLHMVKPRDTNTILHLARFYILHQMDVSGLIVTLNEMLTSKRSDEEDDTRGQAKHILQLLQDYEKRLEQVRYPQPKRRTADVKYAVGMIMKDRLYNLCVITGWDAKCDKTRANSEDIQQQQGCGGRLDMGNDQPFYHIFVEDGSSRYVAQENLLLTRTPGWVNHYEIGRYFCRFMGTYYQPNAEKCREYPEDEEIREEYHGIHSCN